jgi:hypothetical protein
MQSDVPDLTGPGIRAAIHTAVRQHDAAADAGGKGHVEQRQRGACLGASARPIAGFSQRARVGVVVDRYRSLQQLLQSFRQGEIGPPADVRRERHAAARKIHRTAEAHSAPVKAPVASVFFKNDFFDLAQHPCRTALAIGGARNASDEHFVLEQRDTELGAADVDRQRIHAAGANSVLTSSA